MPTLADLARLDVRLLCMICQEPMRRALEHDRDGCEGYVCDSPHPSVPVLVKTKIVEVDGVPTVDA